MGRRFDVVIDSERCLLSCVSHLALVTPFLDKAFVEVQHEIAVCDVWCNPEGDCQDMVFGFELLFRPIRLITGRLPITFLPFLLFSHDFMTL